jgi:SAM-dependent methyltransferase
VTGASFDGQGQDLWPELTREAVPNLVLSPTFVTVPPPPKPVVEKPDGPKKPSLHILRHMAVHDALRESGARSILDLGCGGWLLLERLVQEPQFVRFLGVETLEAQLGHAQRRGERKAVNADIRIEAIQGSVLEFDPRMAGFDAATMVEVIEHLPLATLPQLAKTLFGQAKPRTAVITTPNAECNRFVENMLPNGFREPTHMFEWTRAEFQGWCDAAACQYGYTVQYRGIGDEREDCGTMTQMATFTRVYNVENAA